MLRSSKSHGQAQPERLRFDSQQDALDYARKLVEDGQDFLARNHIDILERYKKSEVNLQLKVQIGAVRNYDLLFAGIPSRWGKSDVEAAFGGIIDGSYFRPLCGNTGRDQQRMLVALAYPIQAPQEVIPSLVWLELPKERLDFVGNLLGRFGHRTLYTVGGPTKGESGAGPGLPIGDRNSVSSVVKRLSEIIDSVPQDFGQAFWEWLKQSDFVGELTRKVRITLTDRSVGTAILECFKFPFEILDVRFCPSEFSPRATK